MARFYEWNAASRSWTFAPNDCGFRTYAPDDVVRLLANRTVLFVGDSTLRNVATAAISSVCNPEHWYRCSQRLHWVFQQTDLLHSMTCGNDTESNRCRELNYTITPLAGLTTDNFYMTKKERFEYWKKGLIPPLLAVQFLGIRFLILEAGCIKPHDGLPKVLDYLRRHSEALPHRPDLVVTAGGFHCTYHEYKKKPAWYHKVADSLFPLSQEAPVVWLEATNCTKDTAGHFIYVRKKFSNLTRPVLNIHKLVNCEFAGAYAGAINRQMYRHGAVISPTRFLTRNITTVGNNLEPLSDDEDASPCAFADPLHPTLKCYGSLLQVHYNTFRIAFNKPKPAPSSLQLRRLSLVQSEPPPRRPVVGEEMTTASPLLSFRSPPPTSAVVEEDRGEDESSWGSSMTFALLVLLLAAIQFAVVRTRHRSHRALR